MRTYEELVEDLALEFMEGRRIAALFGGNLRSLKEAFDVSMDVVFSNLELMRPEDAKIIKENQDILKRDVYQKVKEMTEDV